MDKRKGGSSWHFKTELNFKRFDIYTGIALNLFERGKIKFKKGATVIQSNPNEYQSGYSDAELISIYQDVHENEINQLTLGYDIGRYRYE